MGLKFEGSDLSPDLSKREREAGRQTDTDRDRERTQNFTTQG